MPVRGVIPVHLFKFMCVALDSGRTDQCKATGDWASQLKYVGQHHKFRDFYYVLIYKCGLYVSGIWGGIRSQTQEKFGFDLYMPK